MAPKEVNNLSDEQVIAIKGEITCDSPNEFLDRFDGNVTF